MNLQSLRNCQANKIPLYFNGCYEVKVVAVGDKEITYIQKGQKGIKKMDTPLFKQKASPRKIFKFKGKIHG